MPIYSILMAFCLLISMSGKSFHNLNHATTTSVLRLTEADMKLPKQDRLARLSYSKGWRDHRNQLLKEENVTVVNNEVRLV